MQFSVSQQQRTPLDFNSLPCTLIAARRTQILPTFCPGRIEPEDRALLLKVLTAEFHLEGERVIGVYARL